MFVCICRAVTDRQIAEAARDGARTVDELGEATGAGTCCGTCRDALAELVAPAPANQHCDGACERCPARSTLAA